MSQPSLKLYGVALSQPVRAVMWLLEINSIPYEFIKMSPITRASDAAKARYLKEINPTGRIPSIEDCENGLTLYESSAILAYLSNKYDLNEWYPNDYKNSTDSLKRRALIDQYLNWHAENTRLIAVAYLRPLLQDANKINDASIIASMPALDIDKLIQQRHSIEKTLKIINNVYLNDNLYIVDNKPSLADLLCYQEIVQLKAWKSMYPYQKFEEKYPSIVQWLKRMEKLPHHDKVHRVLKKINGYIEQRLNDTKPLNDAIASKL